jgi:hypothetical protein
MAYAIAFIVVLLAICGIVKAIGGDRYANMTEEEFEEEAIVQSGRSCIRIAESVRSEPPRRIRGGTATTR